MGTAVKMSSACFIDPKVKNRRTSISKRATGTATEDQPVIDRIFEKMKAEYPDAETIEVHIPETKASVVGANANPDEETYWKLDYRYYDQHTLNEVTVDHIYGRFPEATAADKLLRMNYDIHTGAILGLPGKFLMFFAGLICASLPVTGVYIWWGRRKKAKREAGKNRERVGLKQTPTFQSIR